MGGQTRKGMDDLWLAQGHGQNDRVEKPTAGLLGIGGRDKTRCTEPRASASGRQPRAKVTSDSLTLAVPCSTGVEFFMGFRGPKAHSNRPGGLSHRSGKSDYYQIHGEVRFLRRRGGGERTVLLRLRQSGQQRCVSNADGGDADAQRGVGCAYVAGRAVCAGCASGGAIPHCGAAGQGRHGRGVSRRRSDSGSAVALKFLPEALARES